MDLVLHTFFFVGFQCLSWSKFQCFEVTLSWGENIVFMIHQINKLPQLDQTRSSCHFLCPAACSLLTNLSASLLHP